MPTPRVCGDFMRQNMDSAWCVGKRGKSDGEPRDWKILESLKAGEECEPSLRLTNE